MGLLVVILGCCVTGVTFIRDKQASDLIFTTLWFNSLLVLLIVNVACCFFGRIWGRKITLVSFGMILFHISFVTMFMGIIYNSLYYFRATIRLTEGETLSSGDYNSYDSIDQGRFFQLNKLKGEATLLEMKTGYKVSGDDKRAAYSVEIGAKPFKVKDLIYITKHLYYKGFKYFPDKEGYSVLVVLYDKSGKELYGAYYPLQSLRSAEEKFTYVTGTKNGPIIASFPQLPDTPLIGANVIYEPDSKNERGGSVRFSVYPPAGSPFSGAEDKPLYAGKVAVGEKFKAGEYSIAVKEVRYWAAMAVRYEPGQPIVLTSLWVALFGVTLTTFARMYKKRIISSVGSDLQ